MNCARTTTVALLGVLSAFTSRAALAADGPKPPCCRETAPPANYTDRSLYQLESKWTSDVGREVKLGVFRGRFQVLALFFTSCEYACPILVHDLKRLQAALPETIRGRVDFLLVTLDSERDTTDVLRAYRARQELAPEHWTLLRGAPDDVRELAALLGVNYQRDARGQFTHSMLVTILNHEGEIVHQHAGPNFDIAETARTIGKLLEKRE